MSWWPDGSQIRLPAAAENSPSRRTMSSFSLRQLILASIACGCAAFMPLTSVNKMVLSGNSKSRLVSNFDVSRTKNIPSLLGLRLSATEDKGTARAVGERDSGRHLDDNSQRAQAVSDLYTPFWNYAAEVEARIPIEAEQSIKVMIRKTVTRELAQDTIAKR